MGVKKEAILTRAANLCFLRIPLALAWKGYWTWGRREEGNQLGGFAAFQARDNGVF